MKHLIVTISIVLFSLMTAHAKHDPEMMQHGIADKLTQAIQDYPDRRAGIVQEDARQTTYSVWPPYYNVMSFNTLETTEEMTVVDKASGHALRAAIYRGDDDVSAITRAVTNFSTYQDKWPDYKAGAQLTTLSDGSFADTLRYKGIAAAVLFVNADRSIGVLYIGVINPAERAAAIAAFPRPDRHPYPATKSSDHLTVSGTVITVKGWGAAFDGAYDVAKIMHGDSCLSGDCQGGKGRKVLATISPEGKPDIRIMEGKFTHDIYVGSGGMLIDGEGTEFDGTYDIEKLRLNENKSGYVAKCVFHPKGSTEAVEGLFYAPHSRRRDSKDPDYKQYTVCTFNPAYEKDKPASVWERDVDDPYTFLQSDLYAVSTEGIADENKRLQMNADYNEAKDREAASAHCTCCGGRGTIVNTSFNYAMASGVNYMKYQEVQCNCCHGTGKASNQTQYKANTDGGANLDYRH